MSAKVSVILTSYNHGKFLQDSIESILNQTYHDFELIIWDDASSDDSWEIIKSYDDSKIKAFQNPERAGGGNINRALQIALGDYVAIHHSDDLWEPEKLEKQVAYLEAHHNIGAVFTNAQAIDEIGSSLLDESHVYHSIFSQENRSRHRWLRYFFEKGNALCHPSVLIRKQCYSKCGLYRSGLAQLGDFDMWIRLCLKYEIHVLPEKLVRFRVRDNEMNSSGNRPETRSRGKFEYSILLSNYLQIAFEDDLLKIFPEAEKYCNKNGTVIHYALARAMLEIKPFDFVVPFALKIIFENINDSTKKRYINIDIKEFIKFTGELDPLQVIFKEHQNEAIIERDGQIVNQSEQIASLNNQIANLRNQIVSMRASNSWRLTAPLRFARHLIRGDFVIIRNLRLDNLSHIVHKLPSGLVACVRRYRDHTLSLIGIYPKSSANAPTVAALVTERCEATRGIITCDPLRPPAPPSEWPQIDVGIVTYNSRRWITGFIDSLLALDYPKDRITLRFVDNSSTDTTAAELTAIAPKLRKVGYRVEVLQHPNHGFGAGHNHAIKAGNAQFCLVSNIDLIFEPDSLSQVVAMAAADQPQAAAWELRQQPFEHPKSYDPITGSTNWNAHTCVLLRRTALDAVNGYDETLFNEDVELSYRLRRAGYLLRYCPAASVWHYSHEERRL